MSTPVEIYFQEIGRTPLLTPDQEVVLAKRIREGDRAARDLMIRSNLRFVVRLARDYEGFGLPLLDLISEGNIGLIKAVERFDPQKGGKLSTYAAWWIKQSIKRALANQSKTIRLPLHAADKIIRMRRTAAALSEHSGRDPTDDELARELDMPVNKVAHLRTLSRQAASLDAPLGDDRNVELGDIVRDENAGDPYHALREKSQRMDLQKMIANLDDRAATIITLRYGIDGDGRRTLEKIARLFGITPERVRQIQRAALRKMRKVIDDRERGSAAWEAAAPAAPGKRRQFLAA